MDFYTAQEALMDIAEMVGSGYSLDPRSVVDAVQEHLNSMRDQIAEMEQALALETESAKPFQPKLSPHVMFGKSHADDVADREEREAQENYSSDIW